MWKIVFEDSNGFCFAERNYDDLHAAQQEFDRLKFNAKCSVRLMRSNGTMMGCKQFGQ